MTKILSINEVEIIQKNFQQQKNINSRRWKREV